jgi:hypothetical protein
MRRLWLGLSLVAAMAVVPAAQATPPVFVPLPAQDFTFSGICAFDVAVHVTANGETGIFFSDGTIIVSGPLAATFSASGKSVSLNVSGPTKISPSGTVIGHGVGIGPTALPDGSVTLAYTAGVADVTTQPATLLHGHVLLDLCAALAP